MAGTKVRNGLCPAFFITILHDEDHTWTFILAYGPERL